MIRPRQLSSATSVGANVASTVPNNSGAFGAPAGPTWSLPSQPGHAGTTYPHNSQGGPSPYGDPYASGRGGGPGPSGEGEYGSRVPNEAELILPPLPEPTPPEYIGGHARMDIYTMMDEMRKYIDGNEGSLRDGLMQEPALAANIFRVLHEAHYLRDSTGAPVPLPDVAPPALPAGYKTWLLKASDLHGGRPAN